jgi:hypothetical protein
VPGAHDCILAKLRRFDEKDLDFAVALVKAGLTSLETLAERSATLHAHPAVIDRIQNWINAMRARYPP